MEHPTEKAEIFDRLVENKKHGPNNPFTLSLFL